MASTQSFTVGATWTRIAEADGGGDGPVVRVDGAGDYVLAVTVGKRAVPPDLPSTVGHRFSGRIDFPLAGEQVLWASAATPISMQVS
ncbi:hypothetical protein [Paracoccus sp. SM22M-07]|uniref:hypothetical protein n=1 Tax=Paracoccus sp. SM22M-07 TaxID=1520813 RepID=UPI00091AE929|nr:hypothetical protein [Paracoccus sp. SM22M-07]OJH45180.1 hypothetical protein IE00_05840 [Paracoccus sp. SM22M-07]